MRITDSVRRILDGYEGAPPGVKANLCRILMAGRLAGTGRVVILPVDQGFEHGPAPQLRTEPGRVRSALPLPPRDRRRSQRVRCALGQT